MAFWPPRAAVAGERNVSDDVLIPSHIAREFHRLIQRHLTEVHKLIAVHPTFAKHMACGLLGAAAALAESVGQDPEEFFAAMRKRVGS